jgi:hypothetical protein
MNKELFDTDMQYLPIHVNEVSGIRISGIYYNAAKYKSKYVCLIRYKCGAGKAFFIDRVYCNSISLKIDSSKEVYFECDIGDNCARLSYYTEQNIDKDLCLFHSAELLSMTHNIFYKGDK